MFLPLVYLLSHRYVSELAPPLKWVYLIVGGGRGRATHGGKQFVTELYEGVVMTSPCSPSPTRGAALEITSYILWLL